MKTISRILLLAVIVAMLCVNACKKDETRTPVPQNPPAAAETFTSLADFFIRYGVHTQTYTIDGGTGGIITSPQGTTISIPTNAFNTAGGMAVTGPVTISFMDIYKKSDMLLSQVTTMDNFGRALKSGGEFSIKAQQAGATLVLAPSRIIHISAPASLSGGVDTTMRGYTGVDTTGGSGVNAWQQNSDSLQTASDYIYSLTNLATPQATWINCDHPCFTGATSTNLTFNETDTASLYSTQIFLLFTGTNSNISLYNNQLWQYAPVGYQATMVAIGERNGKLYSSFSNITITTNMVSNFSLSQTTSAAFITQLNALN